MRVERDVEIRRTPNFPMSSLVIATLQKHKFCDLTASPIHLDSSWKVTKNYLIMHENMQILLFFKAIMTHTFETYLGSLSHSDCMDMKMRKFNLKHFPHNANFNMYDDQKQFL